MEDMQRISNWQNVAIVEFRVVRFTYGAVTSKNAHAAVLRPSPASASMN